MVSTQNQGGLWTPTVWQAINASTQSTFTSIAVARKVFPAVHLPGVMAIPVDTLTAPGTLSIPEGQTKPYFEMEVRFTLTNGQVNSDPTGQAALTLAPLAAKSLAIAEDQLFFQGAVLPPATVTPQPPATAPTDLPSLSTQAHVPVVPSAPPSVQGADILLAITTGIGQLIAQAQAPAFGLILSTDTYAVTFGSLIGSTPTSAMLASILGGGIVASPAMPPNTGLLVALGGNPTTIFFADPPAVEFLYRDPAGLFIFRVFERVQINARDTNAFVVINFP